MAKLSKRAKSNRAAVEGKEFLPLDEAVSLVKSNATSKSPSRMNMSALPV